MSQEAAGPDGHKPSVFSFSNMDKDVNPDDENDVIMHGDTARLNFSSHNKKTDAQGALKERYGGALEMLRSQLWNSSTASNISFEEAEPDEAVLAGRLASGEMDLSQLISIECDLCSKSCYFLKNLLMNREKVPTTVIDRVLSDGNVLEKLRRLNSTFSFGKRAPFNKSKINPLVANAIKTVTNVFNGSTLPAVMWPCMDKNANHNERVYIDESVLFEATQVYRLRKHNRDNYVEWGRSLTNNSKDEGTLAMDVTDPIIIREISDTIMGEITSTMWCLNMFALHLNFAGKDNLRSYANNILADHKGITTTMWNYYQEFSSHMNARYSHIKDVDKSLCDKLAGRMVVEAHRVVVLQCHIVKTLLAIHIGSRSMHFSEFQRYASHFQNRKFRGVFPVVRNLVGADQCEGSMLLTHAVQELQALGTLLLTSFFIYGPYNNANDQAIPESCYEEIIEMMRIEISGLESGKGENFYSAILVLAFACFVKRLPRKHPHKELLSNTEFDFDRYTDHYSESLEWIVYSRDMFASVGHEDVFVNFPCRLLIMESVSQFIQAFGVQKIRRLDSVVNSISILVDKSDVQFGLGYYATKKFIMDTISEHLMAHFPFGIHVLFQLLGAFLPQLVEPQEDGDMDIDGDRSCVEVILHYLLKSFKTLTVSPVSAPLEQVGETLEMELKDNMYVGIQMLYMLGFDKQLLQENWGAWDMGNCLYVLKNGTKGKQTYMEALKNLSYEAHVQSDTVKKDFWLVDTGLNVLTPHHANDDVWMVGQSLLAGERASRLCGCTFELENTMELSIMGGNNVEASMQSGKMQFTLLRALWLVWHGSIMYMASDIGDFTAHTLQTFVTCNSLMTSLIKKYPRISSLIETHITTSLYLGDSNNYSPFGHANIIFYYTLLFLVCLKKQQLRVLLPDVIEALRSFLLPAYVVPMGDNATEVEFSRCWIFFQSMEYCSQILSDENGLHIFTLLNRVMQEEERIVRMYPVTSGILKLFRDILRQCPPELWMLSGWHHGMLNMSHTSLEMESNNLTHGLGLPYLRGLKEYIDDHQLQATNLYSPFQSLLLCEMFNYVLKNVGLGLGECEFSDFGQRFDMLLDVIEIVNLMCHIFRVSNYKVAKPAKLDNARGVRREDTWVQGVNELINRILLVFSESNYIMEVVNLLGHQLDVLQYHQEVNEGAVVMINALDFSVNSLSFFTPQTMMYRRVGLAMLVSKEHTTNHTLQCHTNCSYSWLSKPRNIETSFQSRKIINMSLKLFRELYVTALPKNRNPLLATLADTLGCDFFMKSRAAADHRRKFLMPSEHIHDLNDPVVFFAMKQMEILCVKLPQVSFILSLFTHTSNANNVSIATDIVSLYTLLREQAKMKSGCFLEHEVYSDRGILQQLGHLRGHHDVITLVDKDRACFYENLICIFFDTKAYRYETRISILQYFLVALSTCSGMELLIRNRGIDIKALLDFIDSILRYQVIKAQNHNLGDVTLAQYALLVFSRLVELSKGSYRDYHWNTINQSLRILISLWRRFDSNFFVDSDVTLSQRPVGLKSTMAKELWFDRATIDYYIDMGDSIQERRLGLLRTMGSVYAILNSIFLTLSFNKGRELSLQEDFLLLLVYVSMNWDFMDTLLPIVVYDSGFVDTYVKTDVTEDNVRQYYRLGLWFGEDCLSPLSRFLHYLDDMKIQSHHLLMQDLTRGIESMDVNLLLRKVFGKKLDPSFKMLSKSYSGDKLGMEIFFSLLDDIMGPPETNGLAASVPASEHTQLESTSDDTTSHEAVFYTFGTSHEFGYKYLTDVEKFHLFSVVLLTSADDTVNFLLSREMPNVRRCFELVPFVESLNELKSMILSKLCDLVDLYKKVGLSLTNRIQGLVESEARVGKNASMRMAKCSMLPFEMFVFNGSMLLQLVLTLPDCIAENPVYVGLLFEFIKLIFVEGVNLRNIEHSFTSYYECFKNSEVDEGGIVDYIVSRDQVTSTDKITVGQEFRLFAINVFGGLVAQVTRYIREFSDRYQQVLDVDFKNPDTCRTSLKSRLTALDACMNYQRNRGTNTDTALGDYNDVYERSMEHHGCVCNIASGKNINMDNVGVWFHFKMMDFFTPIYRLFSKAAKSGYEMESDVEEESILDVYQRVTKYTIKGISRCFQNMISLFHTECEYLLQCFVDAGTDNLRDGELESVYLFLLGPYSLSLVSEAIVSTEFSREFLTGKGYSYIMEMVQALALLPYTASVCISLSLGNDFSHTMNTSVAMKRDRNYMALCMQRCRNGIFHYENNNWLRATLYKCLERMNSIMMHGASRNEFMNSVIESQLLQRIYVYSFLSHFIQPLQYINPKTMLARFSDSVEEVDRGGCVEVIENNVTMWYPPYQAYCRRFLTRCPYHRLHCGLLRFVVEACNFHVVGNRINHFTEDVEITSLVLSLIHLMRLRIRYLLQLWDLSLAHIEECNMIFSLLRHVPSINHLGEKDIALMKDIIQWSLTHFSIVIKAFQNGIDKLSDHIKPVSIQESVTTVTKVTNDTGCKVKMEKPHSAYQQRCLYLIMKSAESFISFLVGLGFTSECDSDIPPTMKNFVKTGNPSGVKRMCPVDSEAFLDLINGTEKEGFKVRVGDYQPLAQEHDLTFEVMARAFNASVELCALALRVCKELRSSSKRPFIFGFGSGGEVILPLSLNVHGVGECSPEFIGYTRCAIYKEVKVIPEMQVDVAPTGILLEDMNMLLECVIEKAVLFSGRVVNTAFLQNQLCQQEDDRAGELIQKWRSVHGDAASGGVAELHSTMTILNNALSDIAAHSSFFSNSMTEYCSVMESTIARRMEQAKMLFEVFQNRFVYTEKP